MKYVIKKNNIYAQVDNNGGYLDILKFNDKDILYPKKILKEDGNNKIRGGSHLCFPNFGVSEKESLNRHGYARELEWKVEEYEDSYIKLKLVPKFEKWNNLTSYLEYKIDEKSFSMKLIAKNNSNKSFYISPAFHPYFNVYDFNDIYINNKKVSLNKKELNNTIYYGKINSIKFGQTKLDFKTSNLEKFVLWSNLTDNYLCVEPTYNWDALDKDKKLYELQSDSSQYFEFEIIF